MSQRIEWIHAGRFPELVRPEDIEEMADDGNDDGDWGVFLGEHDGAMLYGSLEEIDTWLGGALREVQAQRKAER